MKHGLLACSHVDHNVQKTEKNMKVCRLAPVLKTFFSFNVSFHILVASLILMALF